MVRRELNSGRHQVYFEESLESLKPTFKRKHLKGTQF